MKRSHFALPEIYDDSLSYYDVLRKLIKSMHVINDNLNKIPEQIANEAKARLLGDQNLQQNINSEATTREQADTTLQQNINAETSAREQADQEIREGVSDKISELKGELTNKIDKPATAPEVGKILKITAVNEDGTFTCEWGDSACGDITECVAIVDGAQMSENVTSVEFAFNAFEYRKVVIQIEAKASSADSQILINCFVNHGNSIRELIRIPAGAISKNNRITVIEWYPTSTKGINIQTLSGHVVNTNITVMKVAKLYQSDMSKIVFSSVLGDAVIPAGTKFFIWGLR